MKIMFIDARKKIEKANINLYTLSELPKEFRTVGLLASAQYLSFLPAIQKALVDRNSVVGGQVLGCDVSNAKKIIGKVDAFLFIGSGKFHAISIAMLGKPVFIFNPESSMLEKITEQDISSIKAKKKTALIKFYSANKIGIIVSTKQGQESLESALELKQKLEKKKKSAFVFICDSINESELENFDCDAWVNTACSALHMEPKILNICDIPSG